MQFGLSHFDIRLNAIPAQSNDIKTETTEDILNNFDPALAPIVNELLAHNIEFNKDSSYYLEDENGAIVAEAALGIISKKIVIDPFDEDSRQRFLEKGYKELNITDFNINDII